MPVKNRCQCPQPPGGIVECEPNQVAMCIIENGNARHVCASPPSGSDATKITWLYQTITGIPKAADEISTVDRITLASGFFMRDNGISVNFSLTEEIKNILRNWDNDERGSNRGGTPNPVAPRGPSQPGRRQKTKKKGAPVRAKKSGVRTAGRALKSK
jgi:hypothetical protein